MKCCVIPNSLYIFPTAVPVDDVKGLYKVNEVDLELFFQFNKLFKKISEYKSLDSTTLEESHLLSSAASAVNGF